jgi:hypothetical protein
MRVLHRTLWATLGMLTIGVSAAVAQQQTQQPTQQQPDKPLDQAAPPIPAIRSPLASAADNQEEIEMENGQKLAPDTTPLAGVQELSVGGPAITHSYWQPFVSFSATGDSNPLSGSPQSSGWAGYGSINGGVDIRRVSGASDFKLDYLGGASFSNDASIGNGVTQSLGFVEKLAFRRETLTLLDSLNYLPEASFGYSAFGIGQLPGSLGTQSGFYPGQSILTPQGQSVANLSAIELDTLVTPRSSITLVGSYSLLHYFDNNLVNSTGYNLQAGYNYQWTRKDTVAIFYNYSGFNYGNVSQSLNAHTIALSYGRKVTGRLSFRVTGGPQIQLEQVPISGNSGSSSGGGVTTSGSQTVLNWYFSTSLNYALRRTAFLVSYWHGLTAGSGVLAGSISDTANGSVSRQLARTFSANLNAGFSRNSGLVAGSITTTPTNQVYDTWFAGGALTHLLGRSMSLSLSYQMQYQTSNAPFCLGTACQTSYLRNLISFTVGWRKQPIPF